MPQDRFYKSREWDALRKTALRRDRYQCCQCGCSIRGVKNGGARPVVDHILTRRERPDLALVLSNLQSLCIGCSNRKSRHDGSYGEPKPEVGVNGFPVGSDWD